MAASIASNSSPTVLIVNKNLMKKCFVDYLGGNLKIRGSDSTPVDSVIIPRSKVAILLVYLSNVQKSASNISDELGESEDVEAQGQLESVDNLKKRISSFYNNHQKPIVILVSPAFGEEEIKFITSELVFHFVPYAPFFLLAHGEAQAASHIQTISKATDIEARKIVRSRISDIIQSTISLDVREHLASLIGISYNDVACLMSSFGGSLGAVASATAEEIHQISKVPKDVAMATFDYFDKDSTIC